MQKWEYLEVIRGYGNNKAFVGSVNGKQFEFEKYPEFYSYLQKLGEQGWELIGVNNQTFFFKRPLE